MKPALTLAATLLVAPLLALGLTACKPAADATFEAKVHAYLLAHPEVVEEALTKLQANQAQAAAKNTLAAVKEHRQALERDPRDFVANPNGSITVVEFFDYRCGYCKLAAPEVVQLVRENPDVRFVFKEFVIFGADSEAAARAQLGGKDQGKYLDSYQKLMGEKALTVANLEPVLSSAGIAVASARSKGNDAAITRQLQDVHELAQALGVEGTPAFFVGDRVIPGADMAALKQAILEAKIKPA
jgi:protein-disulfide isomerase